MMARLSALLLFVVAMAGCSREPLDSDSYFPLTPGLQWTYRVTTEVGGNAQERTLVISNDAVEQWNGASHTVRLTDRGTRYFVRERDDGFVRAAKRTIVATRPEPDDPQRWILRKPFNVGTSWSQETHPYVLRRIQPYEERLTRDMQFKMAYQIGALDETVDVPAGRFEHCVRVDGEALLTVYADGRTGYQDIQINTSEWYAPGVGLVKLERNEPLTGEVFVGGRIVMALTRFER